MEAKLKVRDAVYGARGWRGVTVASLWEHLIEEVSEAEEFFPRVNSSMDPEYLERFCQEITDIANMCMMMVDIIRRRVLFDDLKK